ncbi:MAG: MEKHLA domain-containing protein [Verrucomicrobiae bacterium]|nr:MEKHLA domain-containing protein [Verrucomicrobiae bacterium]
MTPPWFSPAVIERAVAIHRSHQTWTGRDLLPEAGAPPPDLAAALFQAPFVLIAHGTEADPVLNYGNRAALDLWEMNWETLVQTPSRLTAEPMARDERARLLAEVTRNGFIAHYAGIRISSTGRRFRIAGATVWNIQDASGHPAGQAAAFDRWEFL